MEIIQEMSDRKLFNARQKAKYVHLSESKSIDNDRVKDENEEYYRRMQNL